MPVENQMSEGRYILVWVNTSRESRYHSEETDTSRKPDVKKIRKLAAPTIAPNATTAPRKNSKGFAKK
jgi:hypothetical protein